MTSKLNSMQLQNKSNLSPSSIIRSLDSAYFILFEFTFIAIWIHQYNISVSRCHCCVNIWLLLVLRQCHTTYYHDDVIKWKHFPRYWPFVWGIHRSLVNSPHKGQWRGALMFSLICTRINGWVNNGKADDLRRYRAHYDVTVMPFLCLIVLEIPSDIGAWTQGSPFDRKHFNIYFREKIQPFWFAFTEVCS